MLFVKAKIGYSAVSGIGLFADAPIYAGMTVWMFHEGVDQQFDAVDLLPLPFFARGRIYHYGYINKKTGKLILCADDARFMNHSSNPNTKEEDDGKEGITVASRAIAVGEEITCDYYSYDADAERKLKP